MMHGRVRDDLLTFAVGNAAFYARIIYSQGHVDRSVSDLRPNTMCRPFRAKRCTAAPKPGPKNIWPQSKLSSAQCSQRGHSLIASSDVSTDKATLINVKGASPIRFLEPLHA
jgi:hypothetical protein